VARLRIRIELSRGGLGVPLHKVASVMSKSQKFLDLLGEDVHIDRSNGEWLGFDFDRESLNFTAEYVGAVTAHQVEAFNAAFDGTTSLRRETIAQFASITDAIGEDEIIGFGLYQTDENAEPTEWRCLSRRDALRIAEGIQLILGTDQESHLPAARDPGLAARIFGDRRDWGAEQGAWSDSLREVQRNLSNRLQRVENQVEQHSELIQDLRVHSATTETSFRNLLSSVEGFCDQATRRIESAAPLALPTWPAETPPKRSRRWVAAAVAFAGGIAIVAVVAWLWPSHPAAATTKEPVVASNALPNPEPVAAPAPVPHAPLVSPAQAVPNPLMRVDLNATDPSWVSLVDEEGNKLLTELLVPGVPRTFEVAKSATLRTGNAGGLVVSVNGRPFGPLGSTGQVREVQIKDGKVLASPK
jgi:hypothetical protein